MLLKNKKVAIIGAGPVGLTMATLLQQKGIDVAVYERDKDAQTRIWGGPLDLHNGSGQDALKKAGLLDRYYALAIPMGRTITDEHAQVFFSRAPRPEEARDNPEINRNDLRQLLLDSLTPTTVIWDRKLTALEERDGQWILHFDNAASANADLVIGANGGMSTVRKYVTDAEIEYTGSFIIQGEVHQPEIHCKEFYNLCNGNILMTASNGITFTANPKNKGALTYGLSFKKPEEWGQGSGLDFRDTDSVVTFLSNRLSSWQDCYKNLFRTTSFFVGLPTRKISLDQAWKQERPLPITLIGDAAHIMPPFAGKGVNTGLMDALILSDNLTNGNFESLDAAIKNYEQTMFVYAKEAQAETRRNELEMHQPGFSFQKRFNS